MRVLDLDTAQGLARAHVDEADAPRGAVVLGHGAGGGIAAPDLTAAKEAALADAFSVALVEQPYRVAGRRSQPAARQLDGAWVAVIEQLRSGPFAGLPIVVGGRSAGARVACRTATEADAVAVLCLAFPLHPPGRADDPAKSRLPELDAVSVPTLVVQGQRDPFGRPPPGARRSVVLVPGDHALRNREPVRAAVADWLERVFD